MVENEIARLVSESTEFYQKKLGLLKGQESEEKLQKSQFTPSDGGAPGLEPLDADQRDEGALLQRLTQGLCAQAQLAQVLYSRPNMIS